MDKRGPVRGYRYPIRPNPRYRIPKEISTEKLGMKLSLILGIIFIFVVVGIVLIFLFFSGKETKQDISDEISEGVSVVVVECGSDIDCFIDETYECNLARLTYDFTLQLFGWIQDHSYYYEIENSDLENCMLYVKIENVSGNYDDVTVQYFLDNNMTQDEINQQEQEINDALQTIIGSDGTCILEQAKLTQIFISLKSGDYSSEDWEGCSGEAFETQ